MINYVSPSIHFTDKLNPKSLFLTTEIFGPNCLILPYNEIEEAIEIANFGEYGLATSVFTRSKDIFNKCIQEIDSGLLNFNKASIGASAKLPFGGIKNSGNYRPAGSVTIFSHLGPFSTHR
ncbi:MAG: aldehyde dehydrogenase family protein [Bacteriovoracaceae bacterium]